MVNFGQVPRCTCPTSYFALDSQSLVVQRWLELYKFNLRSRKLWKFGRSRSLKEQSKIYSEDSKAGWVRDDLWSSDIAGETGIGWAVGLEGQRDPEWSCTVMSRSFTPSRSIRFRSDSDMCFGRLPSPTHFTTFFYSESYIPGKPSFLCLLLSPLSM